MTVLLEYIDFVKCLDWYLSQAAGVILVPYIMLNYCSIYKIIYKYEIYNKYLYCSK